MHIRIKMLPLIKNYCLGPTTALLSQNACEVVPKYWYYFESPLDDQEPRLGANESEGAMGGLQYSS